MNVDIRIMHIINDNEIVTNPRIDIVLSFAGLSSASLILLDSLNNVETKNANRAE
jgi:hypothetical protein